MQKPRQSLHNTYPNNKLLDKKVKELQRRRMKYTSFSLSLGRQLLLKHIKLQKASLLTLFLIELLHHYIYLQRQLQPKLVTVIALQKKQQLQSN